MGIAAALAINGSIPVFPAIQVSRGDRFVVLNNRTLGYELWLALGGPATPPTPSASTRTQWTYDAAPNTTIKVPTGDAFDGTIWLGVFAPAGVVAPGLEQFAIVGSYAPGDEPDIAGGGASQPPGGLYLPGSSGGAPQLAKGVEPFTDASGTSVLTTAVQPDIWQFPASNDTLGTTAGSSFFRSINPGPGAIALVEGIHVHVLAGASWLCKVAMSGWQGPSTFYVPGFTTDQPNDILIFAPPRPIQGAGAGTNVIMTITNNSGGALGSNVEFGLWGSTRTF